MGRTAGDFGRFVFGVAVFLTVGVAGAADLRQATRLFHSGQYAECIDLCQEGLAENEFNEAFPLLKLRAELELGRYAEAMLTFDAAQKAFPKSLRVRWLGRQVVRFNRQAELVSALDEQITKLLREEPWRYTDGLNQVTAGRFLLAQGIDPKRVLDAVYGVIKQRQPAFAESYTATGDLALEKQDFALAAQSFQQAAKLDPEDPAIPFGLAQAFAESDDEECQKAIDATLKLNPRYVPLLLFLADRHIDAERYDEAETVLQQVSEVNPHHPIAGAYRAVTAHLQNQPEREREFRDAALRFWPMNPEVDYTIGKKLSQKYRFAEGASYQRQALAFDRTHVPSHLQLAQDLLRLGLEDEGWKLAEAVSKADEYNVVAHNLVTLQENLSKFRTIEADGFVLRMEAREADLYGGRVLELLSRAKATLAPKYGVTLDQPVIVEMFPRQQDFAIRTFGLPGGAGFLGVCFGTVITANSPASQGETPSCWEATLWHEFCHVVTLTKTRNKMPRWLSEGISVYEEGRQNPSWGQAITPQYRQMLLGDDLTPVSELSGAFLHAKTPLHLQFAYFESALVVEFLIERHGEATLRQVLDDLSVGMPINESLGRHVGSIEELDAEFTKFARARANAMAPEADWSEPELPRRADAATVAAYVKEHPKNYAALQRLAAQSITEKKWADAKQTLETMRGLFPGDASPNGVYAMLAAVSREMGENSAERSVLETLAGLSANNVEAFARLIELGTRDGDWNMVRDMAQRWLAVNPLQPGPHRAAAEAAEKLQDRELTLQSCQALLQLDPIDPAGLHLRLATALEEDGQLALARRHAILALEETPRYRAAYQRLGSIVGKLEPPVATDAPPAPPVAVPEGASP